MNWQNFNSRALDKHVALNNMLIQMEQMENLLSETLPGLNATCQIVHANARNLFFC